MVMMMMMMRTETLSVAHRFQQLKRFLHAAEVQMKDQHLTVSIVFESKVSEHTM